MKLQSCRHQTAAGQADDSSNLHSGISYALLNADGKLEESYGPAFPLYSMTKTFTAYLIMKSGIDINAKIDKWISQDECIHGCRISVSNLLNHSSGLKDYGPNTQYQIAVKNRESPWTDKKYQSITTNSILLFEPGQRFSYSNAGYWLLKTIIERETDRTWEELIHELIAVPMNLKSLNVIRGIVDESVPDYNAGWVWHGLLRAEARDAVSFYSDPFVRSLTANSIKVSYKDKYWKNPRYGMGLMMDNDLYGHMGGGPGFEAACFHNAANGKTCCTIASAAAGKIPIEIVLEKII